MKRKLTWLVVAYLAWQFVGMGNPFPSPNDSLPAPVGPKFSYVAQTGDTKWTISAKFQRSWAEIVAYNADDSVDPNRVQRGKLLWIPVNP